MTAVVGILNKRAVAIASDSAATLNNGKIFNKAKKMFSLSKSHPIGIMIHNEDGFMGTPWEVIINMYCNKLGTTKFDTLKEYQQDFLEFVRNQNMFSSVEHQLLMLHVFFIRILNGMIEKVSKSIDESDPQKIDKILSGVESMAEARKQIFEKFSEKMEEFKSYSYDDFETFITPRIHEVFKYVFTDEGYTLTANLENLFKNLFYYQIIAKETYTDEYTGLIFTGFGEKEVFPSLIPIQVYLAFDNKIRYFIKSESGSVIDHSNTSDICMFAQSDVMFTILTGVSPALKKAYKLNFSKLLKAYGDTLLDNYNNDKGDLMFLLNNIDKNTLVEEISKEMDKAIQVKYTDPLFQAVGMLSIEDLSEMAESLIYLTYLQRRITNAEESVGGPVDVAILTKGDGFIWIKKKQYYDPKLNSHNF